MATVCAHSKPIINKSVSHLISTKKTTAGISTNHLPSTVSPTKHPSSTPTDLVRQNRFLESQIRTTREDLDTLRQATKLLQSRRDDELTALVTKWRRVSREAAEEVFTTVKERVNRMGGVGAWREREAKKREWAKEWDAQGADGAPDEDGDSDEDEGSDEGEDDAAMELQGLDEVDRARLKEMKKEYRRETREQREVVKGAVEEGEPEYDAEKPADPILLGGKDDDEFTIDMMLRVLNIELEVIGYDKDEQRWID